MSIIIIYVDERIMQANGCTNRDTLYPFDYLHLKSYLDRCHTCDFVSQLVSIVAQRMPISATAEHLRYRAVAVVTGVRDR